MSKRILKIILIMAVTLIALIIGICIYLNSKNNILHEDKTSNEPTIIDEESENKNNESDNNDHTVELQEDDKTENENNNEMELGNQEEEVIDPEQSTEVEEPTISNQEPITNQNSNNVEIPQQNTVIQPTVPNENTNSNLTIPPEPSTPSCTSKKFIWNWVRADFTDLNQCMAIGKLYSKDYVYACDNYQDDCGDVYYMLVLTKKNTNIEYDFHTIPIPE